MKFWTLVILGTFKDVGIVLLCLAIMPIVSIWSMATLYQHCKKELEDVGIM